MVLFGPLVFCFIFLSAVKGSEAYLHVQSQIAQPHSGGLLIAIRIRDVLSCITRLLLDRHLFTARRHAITKLLRSS